MHVEHVGTTTPYKRTVVPWHTTIRTTSIELHATDATRLVVGHPMPGSYRYPTFDFDFHGYDEMVGCYRCNTWNEILGSRELHV